MRQAAVKEEAAEPILSRPTAQPSLPETAEVAAEEQTGTTANRSTSLLPYTLLEGEMGMSRASLFNKMKAITGMGCNEYIIKIRMEKAILMKNI
ncbi:MAG: hypothetical protein ACI3ZW_03065 [Parabacteroides sp.]|nr:hypothetical protein [Parabacteroides sp.]MCI7009084.1 hypothetical protein [Parabacteroides sp.]MCI7782726.1 hypothetical protein [Parabacteroides sp.]